MIQTKFISMTPDLKDVIVKVTFTDRLIRCKWGNGCYFSRGKIWGNFVDNDEEVLFRREHIYAYNVKEDN